VTAQGWAYHRFRRALQFVGLTEALELCLLLVEKSPERFGRAAPRWRGGYCRELRDVELDEGLAVLGLLAAMRGPRSEPVAFALADLLSAGASWSGRARLFWSGPDRSRPMAYADLDLPSRNER
jgi:hypothetical protein